MTIQYQGVWSLQSAAQLQSTQRWVTDPLYKNTTLLLQADDAANAAQNNTFLDSSSNNFTITRNGNTTQGTFTPFSQSPGWWSNYFPGGNGKYIYAPYNAVFDFGTGDFSVECFAYVTDAGRRFDSNKYGTFVSGGNPVSLSSLWTFGFLISSGVINQLTFSVNGSDVLTASSQSISLNAWHHFVVCRTGTTISIYVDGTRVATATYSSAVNTNSSGAVFISQAAYQDVYENWLIGNISNVRIIKGTQPYNAANSSITVPTAQLTNITNTSLLTCLSNRFIDTGTANGGNPFTITIIGTGMSVQPFSPFAPQYQWTSSVIGGSGYFDGTTDYLTYTTPSTVVREWWVNDFTVEAWIYPTTLTGWDYSDGGNRISTVIGNASPTATNNFWSFGPINTGAVRLYYFNGAGVLVTSTETVKVNQWNHIAFTKTSTGICIFVNGVGTTATAVSGTPQSGNTFPLTVGQINNTACNGYISGVRILNGTAQYSGTTYTIPTAPPTAITNTSLLLNFTNAGIFDGTMKNVLETVGSAQISTAVVKYGSGSIFLDGTGDWLLAQRWTGINASENFTLEGWVYLTATPSTLRMIFSDLNASNANQSTYWSITTTGMSAQFGASAGTSADGTFSFSANIWYHVAVVRNNNAVSMYVNGNAISVANSSQSASFLTNSSLLYVGRWGGSPTYEFIGYMDDVRITKGIARYTANFIPPSVALPRQ